MLLWHYQCKAYLSLRRVYVQKLTIQQVEPSYSVFLLKVCLFPQSYKLWQTEKIIRQATENKSFHPCAPSTADCTCRNSALKQQNYTWNVKYVFPGQWKTYNLHSFPQVKLLQHKAKVSHTYWCLQCFQKRSGVGFSFVWGFLSLF